MAAPSERRVSTAVPLGDRQRRSDDADGSGYVFPVGPPLLVAVVRRMCIAVSAYPKSLQNPPVRPYLGSLRKPVVDALLSAILGQFRPFLFWLVRVPPARTPEHFRPLPGSSGMSLTVTQVSDYPGRRATGTAIFSFYIEKNRDVGTSV